LIGRAVVVLGQLMNPVHVIPFGVCGQPAKV
jgi:hypothetical protein